MAQNHLEDLLTDASFVRWIRGEASLEEDLKWNAWFKSDPHHQQLIDEARDVILAFQKEEIRIPDVSREWQRLERLIDQEKEQNKVFSGSRVMQLPRKNSSILVTALLIIGLFLGVYAVFQNQLPGVAESELATNSTYKQEYRTDYGEKVTFRLSDNSRIVLNANSLISFSTGIDGGLNSTEVWLQGEAWFDITHLEGDRQRTFTVHTDDGTVQVLGTRFAVKTFENETRAVLEEGKIQVRVAHQTSEQQDSYIMKPGEMALFSTGKKEISLKTVNTRIYTSWNEDIWFFDDTPLDEIGRRIEDTFGIEVVIQDELANRKLSGSVKGTNLNVVSEALAKILEVEIEQQDRKLLIGIIKNSQQ